MPNCQYIVKPTNTGSAATRNFLAERSHYPWLLFIDCDVEISNPSFLRTYLLYIENDYDVINGGIAVADIPQMGSNLRYIYEKAAEADHTAAKRQKQRYQEFRSTNFMIRRDVFLQNPFDERFTKSGYEDVLFGKHLKLNGISILHIDNPVTMTEFETNPDYVAKTERNLRTLYQFRSDLRGYSRLLTLVSGIHIPAILWLMRLWHRMFGAIERRNLCGSRPYLLVFKLYRLGYYLSLTR
jgi:glycosyltransferase involved in cell wall biosynthesis